MGIGSSDTIPMKAAYSYFQVEGSKHH
jgi:hypothetical protein